MMCKCGQGGRGNMTKKGRVCMCRCIESKQSIQLMQWRSIKSETKVVERRKRSLVATATQRAHTHLAAREVQRSVIDSCRLQKCVCWGHIASAQHQQPILHLVIAFAQIKFNLGLNRAVLRLLWPAQFAVYSLGIPFAPVRASGNRDHSKSTAHSSSKSSSLSSSDASPPPTVQSCDEIIKCRWHIAPHYTAQLALLNWCVLKVVGAIKL